MKILRVSNSFARENLPGSGLSCYYHCKYSSDENLVLTAYKEGSILDVGDNVQVEQIKISNFELGKIKQPASKALLNFFLKAYVQFIFLVKSYRYIKRFKPDLVHVYTPIPLLIGLYCKYRYKSTLVMSLHGTDVERIISSKIFRKILNLPDAVLSVSETTINRIRSKGIKTDIIYMGNGYSKKEFNFKNYKRKNQFVHIGNLRWQKGQQYLIESFAKFVKIHSDFKLIIIGDGNERDNIEKMIERLSISEKVILMGVQPRNVVSEILNESKFFILTSLFEGSPKVVLEAMATGTPVISTDVGNVRKVIKDSGIIVPIRDSELLYKGMIDINEDSNWTLMSEKAIEYSGNYTWDAVSTRLDQIYSSLIKQEINK